MIERERERAVLQETIADSPRRGLTTLVVEGAAGCGKSELVAAVPELAMAAGAIALSAACSRDTVKEPLDVMHQLVAGLPEAARTDLRAVLDRDPDMLATAPDPQTHRSSRLETLQEFCGRLADLAAVTRLVIVVDDIQLVDDASLHYLRHLWSRARHAGITMVFTESLHATGPYSMLNIELLRLPNSRRVRLERLSRAATAQYLANHLGGDCADLAEVFDAVCAGNPLLMRALLEDVRIADPADRLAVAGRPHVGTTFAHAVRACLDRIGPDAAAVAAALAVLGELASPELLVRLLDITHMSVSGILRALRACGLVVGYRFRHRAAEPIALESIDPDYRRELDRHAAKLLHDNGHPVDAVARHILAAGIVEGNWEITALRDAADQALARDDGKQAAAYTEFAARHCVNEVCRAEIFARLAAITWRTDPAAAEEYLTEPVALARKRQLPASTMEMLVKLLSAHGRVDEAKEIIAQLRESWADELPSGAPTTSIPGTPGFHAITTPWAQPDFTFDETVADSAEQLLRTSMLTDTTLSSLIGAINALAFADRPDKGLTWAQRLYTAAGERDARGWQAVFACMYADMALLTGDLGTTVEWAEHAMDIMSTRSASIFTIFPLAAQINAYTAMGRHDEAARQINKSIPGQTFDRYHGIRYLRARGGHYLAVGSFEAALEDFLHIGKLAKRWAVDKPEFVPWRIDAARAWLELGERGNAETLIGEQLAHADRCSSRVRGMARRLSAALLEPRRRQAVLAQAVDDLHASRDRYQLSVALNELSAAYQDLGERASAEVATTTATRLARECGIEDRAAVVHLPSGDALESAPWVIADSVESKLTESERRVAVLAAYGHSNREIAGKLHITASTVEQHLTRVFRKLDVRRPGLAAALLIETDPISTEA